MGQPLAKDIWFLRRGKEEMGAVKWVYRDRNIPSFLALCQPDSPLQYKPSKGERKRSPLLSPLPIFSFLKSMWVQPLTRGL
jgi:hypothetical protein